MCWKGRNVVYNGTIGANKPMGTFTMNNTGTIALNTATVNVNGDITLNPGGAMTIGAAYSPTIRATSGNIALHRLITKSAGANASLNLQADGSVTVNSTAGITSTSNKLNVTIAADYDGSGAGSVETYGDINSNGGDITIGGGTTPASTPAVGDAADNAGVHIESNLTSGGGNISLRGKGRDNATTFAAGVYVKDSTIDSGGGSVTMNGTGGANSGALAEGVHLRYAQVNTGAGAVTITGTGGAGSGATNFGVQFSGLNDGWAKVSTTAGNVTVNGTGGAGSAGASGVAFTYGMYIASGGVVSVTGTGGASAAGNHGIEFATGGAIQGSGASVTLTGTGGASGAGNIGIKYPLISSTGGPLTLTGHGNGANGHGIQLGGTVSTTNSTLSITGDAPNGDGVLVVSSNSAYATGSGLVSITGTSTNAIGVHVDVGAGAFSNTGELDITGTGATAGIYTETGSPFLGVATGGQMVLTADTMHIDSSTVIQSSGNLLIQPLNAATTIGVGDSASGTLNWTSAEVATLQDGFGTITFGRLNGTGNINITAGAFTDPVEFRIPQGNGDITLDGAVTNTGGSVTLQASRDVILSSGSSITTQGAAIILNSDRDNSNGGAIEMDTASLTSNDGDIVLAGGADPLIGQAESSAVSDWGIKGVGTAISSGAGNIRLQGTTWANVDGIAGVQLIGGSIQSTTGMIRIIGASGGSANSQRGVELISNQVTTTSGTILILGNAGNSPGNDNQGTRLVNATVTSDSGNMQIAGQGGRVGADNYGLNINSSSTIATGATGDISITGFGGTGTDNNAGVVLNSNITVADGGIFITGDSHAAGVVNDGVRISLTGAQIAALGNGTIEINGTASGDGQGVSISNAGELATHAFGTLNILGIGAGDGSGISTTDATVGSPASSGAINLMADTMDLAGSTTISSQSSLLIHPSTAGTSIGLGNGASGTLNLSGSELAAIQPGFSTVVFDANGGDINTTAVTMADPLVLQSANNIQINGALVVSAPLTLSASGNVSQSAPLTANGLLLLGAADYGLGSTQNDFGTLAANTTGSGFYVINNNSVTIGNVNGVNGVTTTANVLVRTDATPGDVTLDAPVSSTATGDAVALGTLGTFTNNVGAGGIDTPNGRWLVYSNVPANDTINGLNGERYYGRNFAVNPPGTIAESGNLIMYNMTPTLTVTADDDSKTYGDPNPAFTYTVTGLESGDSLNNVFSGTPALDSTGVNVGVHPITTAAGTAAASHGYAIAFVDGNLTINPAALTITADDKSKTYGAANPTFTAGYSGFKNGDTAAVVSGLNLSTAATSGSNVGTYTITASGATASNYTITHVNGTLTIDKAALTITADDKTKTYGAANPALTATYTGLVNGDNSSVVSGLNLSTAATSGSDVGTYTITAGGGTASNYTITHVDGTLTIDKAALTITADDKSRTYGAANPTLTASYSGLVNGDTVAVVSGLNVATGATSASDVGTYTITASGGSASNYTITHVDGTLTIDPAALTITADGKSKIYGAALPTLTASYSGFVNGDSAAVVSGLNLSTTAHSTDGVGVYPITASGAGASNYSISYVPGTLTITPAALTITANDKTKVYGAANPTLTASYTGLVNGDTAAVVTGLNLSTAAANSNAGTYAITATGGSASNYTITRVNGTMTITPAPLTITADDKTKAYSAANPTLTATYTGLVNGDDASDISGVTLATTATNSSNIGTYPITVSGSLSSNYTITQVDGTLTINRAMLNITADDKTKVYGAAMPTLTATITGFVNGDNESVVSGLAINTSGTAGSNVGTYSIDPSGATASNYDITFHSGTLDVTRATLLISADDKTKVYGAANPQLTWRVDGLVNGDDRSVISGLVVSTVNAGTGVGTYPIDVYGASAGNYSVTCLPGLLQITPASLTIAGNELVRPFFTKNPPLTYEIDGLVNGDDATVINGLVVNTPASRRSNVGSYPIVVSGAASPNYTITMYDGRLTVYPDKSGQPLQYMVQDMNSFTGGSMAPALLQTDTTRGSVAAAGSAGTVAMDDGERTERALRPLTFERRFAVYYRDNKNTMPWQISPFNTFLAGSSSYTLPVVPDGSPFAPEVHAGGADSLKEE